MKPENSFNRPGSLRIEWQPRDRYFVCWRPHVSQLCTDRKEVLRFARWPASTPTGQALREWLTELEQRTLPATDHDSDTQAHAAATGFGPEQHDPDDHDPTANTRTII